MANSWWSIKSGIVAIEPKTGNIGSCNRSILRPFNLVGRQKSKTTPCCTTTHCKTTYDRGLLEYPPVLHLKY
jgi:hypothetical protein